MFEISQCEVCGSRDLTMVLDLGLHPLCDDLIPLGTNKFCKEYPVQILFCKQCITAHQRWQVPKHKLFSNDYHYRARMTGSVLKGMSDLVEACERKFGDLSRKTVLDIGCNDGSLLNFFRVKGCNTIGVEPTGAYLDSSHTTFNKFFDKECANDILDQFGTPHFITFTNVFAHIENLSDLIGNLKILIGPHTKVVIENHYLGSVLDYSQFDTFYHEHPRSYSLSSFLFIAERLSLSLLDYEFVSRYGGNIRVILGGDNPIDYLRVDESNFFSRFAALNVSVLNWRWKTHARVRDYVVKYGPLRAKAFPGRAAILIRLLGLDETSISAVYEIKGSIKVHHYVPGTRIPILPESELYAESNQTLPILNLAWHLPMEVTANLRKNGYLGDVIQIKNLGLESV